MLWLKAFHIIFVVTWFAGLFYLPRLFLYHAQTNDATSIERFIVMEQRLFGIMTIGGTLALTFGVALIAKVPQFLAMHWLHAKLTLVALLIAYHISCYGIMRSLRVRRDEHSRRWYALFNEVPALLLIAIVVLVVVKPF